MTTALERMGREQLLHRIGDLTDSVACLKRRIEQLEVEKKYAEEETREMHGRCDHLQAVTCRVLGDHATMLETLTHAQARGTELIDETRALRRALLIRLDQRMTAWGAPAAIATEQVNILVDLLKVRWRGDAKYGGAEAHADRVFRFRNDVENDLSTGWAREKLAVLRAKKGGPSGYADWRSIVLEEVLELLAEDGVDEDRIEAEALDLANVCLKMVEAIRIRRARTEAK